jgi:membrane-bound lytic murein transglycosylase F
MFHKLTGWMFKVTAGLIPIGAAVALVGFARPPDTVGRIVESGELVVATRAGSATYYQDGRGGAAGFEYDLARRFADYLGVKLRMVVADNADGALAMVLRKEAHLAAAAIPVADDRVEGIRFGPSYYEITQQLVYRNGLRPPRDIDDVARQAVAVACEPGRLKKLLGQYPAINWRQEDLTTDALLTRLSHADLSYAVMYSNEVETNQPHFPELRVAFDLTEPEPIAWAFPKDRDDSLLEAARAFFAMLEEDGELDELRERYYGRADDFDYVGVRRFLRQVAQRLPRYLDSFRSAAAALDHDWRLLAAVGYQESHWDPNAVSPTGVQGIMMLTNRTAAELGIEDRIDPSSSISGGARYLRQILSALPGDIAEPDRTWFALAAYNIGFGHLEDARDITRRRGGDPNKWMAVKDSLPLLTQKRWYQTTRYGFARGNEAVHYVQNIRNYYDILVRAMPFDVAPGPQVRAASSTANNPA